MGGAKFFRLFRVKNHDFTPKNHIFPNFRGDARRVRPPLDPPLDTISLIKQGIVYLNTVFKIKNFFIPNISYSSQST